ncbi:MAG: PAS domain S-box protein, partial [Chitinophagaceae bacterium]
LYLTFSAGLVNVNLLRMVNKELHIELRSVITKAVKDQTIVKSSIKKFDLFGSTHYVRIACLPLYYKEGVDDLYLVIFEPLDLSDLVFKTPGSSPTEREEQNEKLQELEHELAATKEHLQTYIEELETSNEELQSLNEEMQSTNEELQSANEELETSNEELQSTNEEIQIAYAELKTANALLEKKEKQLQENEANLNAMLSNDLQAFILIDKTYNIVSFNNKAKETFFELTRKRLKKGVSFIDYLDLSLLEQFLTDFKNSIKGSAITREVSIKSIALHTRSYLFNFTPVVYNQDGISAISLGVLEITALKETLFKLSEAQELITSVFDATSIGICVTDSSGSFVNMNNQYCQLYGYQKSELLGKSFTVVVPKENRTYAQKLHDDFIQTGMELPGEWIVQKKDGSFMEIFVTAELLVQKDGSRFKVTSIRDITEQNKYKNLLIQTQKSGKIGGWEIELSTGKAFWTEEMYKILDESVDAVLNEDSLYHYFEANDAEELKILLDTAKETGSEFSINYHITTAKGIQKDLHITCKAIKINNTQVKLFGTLQDITEQKSTEENYRKLFMAAEQSPSSIVITNLKGEIEFVNPAFYAISGYSKHEVIGQNPRFLKSGYTTEVE